MELFERVRERILATGRAARLSATDVDALQRRHSGLPTDYLRFLTEVGYGDLGEIQLHSGPAAATNFYSNPSSDLASVLVFGDDKQHHCFGFDTQDDFRVVEISPSGELTKDVESDFLSLLRAYFGCDGRVQ